MNNLVIAAHPDDEVLGCGGTIARLTNEKENVYVAILGEGVTSRYNRHKQSNMSSLKTLKNHCRSVSDFLKVKNLFFFDLPDNRFDTIPLLDIVKMIESLLDKLKPSTIFTHHSGDLNVDHHITHRATLTATRPLPGCTVKKVYAYEVPSSTEWSVGGFSKTFQANVFVDISDTLEEKVKAMSIYKSEVQPFPHPRSPEALRALAKLRGTSVGLPAAEAFELIREII